MPDEKWMELICSVKWDKLLLQNVNKVDWFGLISEGFEATFLTIRLKDFLCIYVCVFNLYVNVPICMYVLKFVLKKPQTNPRLNWISSIK